MATETALLFFGKDSQKMKVFNFASAYYLSIMKTFQKLFCVQFHHIMSRSASNATRTTDRSSMKTKDDCTVPKESRENLLQPDVLQAGSEGSDRPGTLSLR